MNVHRVGHREITPKWEARAKLSVDHSEASRSQPGCSRKLNLHRSGGLRQASFQKLGAVWRQTTRKECDSDHGLCGWRRALGCDRPFRTPSFGRNSARMNQRSNWSRVDKTYHKPKFRALFTHD